MNISTSECSSGCESGWTMYLDQISTSTDKYNRVFNTGSSKYVHQEDDEDLSMVSDASSGPPIFHKPEAYLPLDSSKKSKSKQKKTKEQRSMQQNLCLDDTASSPVFHFSQDNVVSSNHNVPMEYIHDFSPSASAATIEDESTRKKPSGLFKSSAKGKVTSRKSGGLLGRKNQ